MKKKSILSAVALIILVVSLFSACVPIPQGIDMSKYFQSNVTYLTYQIDPGREQGWLSVGPDTIPLTALTDENENNITFRNYLRFAFTMLTNAKELKIKSLSFIVQAEEDIVIQLTFNETKNSNPEAVVLEVAAKKNQKIAVTKVFETPIEYVANERTEITIHLANILEVGEIKYSLDSFLLDAEIKKESSTTY